MLILLWPLVIALAVLDQSVMTVIVRREYLNHRSDWESDGKPRGTFWIPKESMIGGWFVGYSGLHALRSLSWNWLLYTPDWIAKNRNTRRLLLLHRALVSAMWIYSAGLLAFNFLR